MRRAILAASLGGLLLTGAACDSDAETGARPAPPAVAPSSAPAIAAPDYTADTRRVCGRLEKLIDSDLPTGFGTAIGRMIAQKEAKATAEADKAEKAAGARLTSAAAVIRRETATARDPDLRAAGAASAAKLTAGAADRRFFDGIRTTQDLDRVIETRMGDWLSPVAGYCA
jgi:alpha-beta hydrolase superfamily lysophospholipase